jgi:sugar/nucleoside kinase (ribokinase family)
VSRTEDKPPRATVVGNLCSDVIVCGLTALPRWAEEAEGDDNLQAPGGQGYNLAVALASLEVTVSLVGVVGPDAAGDRARHGVLTDTVAFKPTRPTAVTVALVRTDGERAFASDFGCQRDRGLADILEATDALTAADVALVGLFTLPGLSIPDARRFLLRAQQAGAMTVLDTGWDPLNWPPERRREARDLLSAVDVFIPNQDETRALTGCDDPVVAAGLLRADGAKTVVVKCGSSGSIAVAAEGTLRVPALDVIVRDAVGAGDSFDAGFIAGRLAGHDLQGCMALASSAAGLRISGDAASWPSRRAAEAMASSLRAELIPTTTAFN